MDCPASAPRNPMSLSMPSDWALISQLHSVSDGVSIGCLDGRPTSNWQLDGISRPGFGIAIVLEGAGAMALDGGPPLNIEAGTAILYSTAQPIRGWDDFRGGHATRIVDIRFTPEGLASLCGHPPPELTGKLLRDCSVPCQNAYLGSLPASREMKRLAADILQYPTNSTSELSSLLFLQAKAMESLALTLRHLDTRRRHPTMPAPYDRSRVQQAYEYILQNYEQDLTVKVLSEQAGISEKRLQAGFTALYGQTIHACLRQTRMEIAASLMEQGWSVTEVADAVGFSSLSHFIKAFKRHWGATPKAWISSANKEVDPVSNDTML